MSPQKYKAGLDRQGALHNVFRQTTHKAAIPLEVLHIIHDGFHQPDAQATLPLFMNQVVKRWLGKTIDVEHLSVVDNFKYKLAFLGNINGQFKKMIWIAVVSMNHEVGTHFVQRQNDLIEHDLGGHMGAQGLPNEVPDALQVLQAATDFKPRAH